jgi:hypothetical protein
MSYFSEVVSSDLGPSPTARPDIFHGSDSGTIWAKDNRKAGQSQPNVAPCRDNLTARKWHDLIIQSYWRRAPIGVVSLYHRHIFNWFILSLWLMTIKQTEKCHPCLNFFHLHISTDLSCCFGCRNWDSQIGSFAFTFLSFIYDADTFSQLILIFWSLTFKEK